MEATSKPVISWFELTCADFAIRRTQIPRDFVVLIGSNGTGKTTALMAIRSSLDIAQRVTLELLSKLSKSRVIRLQDGTPSVEELGDEVRQRALPKPKFIQPPTHVHDVSIGFSNGLTVRTHSIKRSGQIMTSAQLDFSTETSLFSVNVKQDGGGPHWKFTFDAELSTDTGAQTPAEQLINTNPAWAACVQTFTPRRQDVFASTRRLLLQVEPSETLLRRYEGVLFSRRSGRAPLQTLLEMMDPGARATRPIDRVLVTAAKIGKQVESLRDAYIDEFGRRDSRLVRSIRAGASEHRSESDIEAALALDQTIQEQLTTIGIGHLPKFIDRLSVAAGGRRNAIEDAYVADSLPSLRRLARGIAPIAGLIAECNRIFAPRQVAITDRNTAQDSGFRTPPDQDYVLATRSNERSDWNPTDVLSSGQQHLLVLLSLIWLAPSASQADTDPPQRLLLLDEPEISLHLAWQTEVAGQIMKAAALGNTQIIVATHSNFISGAVPFRNAVEISDSVYRA